MADDMTTPSEDEILALAKRATPGPWDCRIAYESDGGVVDPHTYKAPGYYNNGGVYSPTADQWPVACDEYNIFEKPDDWAYIAAANPAAIIALIERRRAEIEKLREEITNLKCMCQLDTYVVTVFGGRRIYGKKEDVEAIKGAIDMAISRGCSHCSDSIAKARAALSG